MDVVSVLSLVGFKPKQLSQLRAVSPRLRLVQPEAEEVPDALWAETEVLCSLWSLPQPEQAPNLRWVHLFSAGADHVLGHPILKQEIILTTSSGVHAINIGEYVLSLMLAWSHRLPALLQNQRQAGWTEDRFRRFAPRELRGDTLGLVGYGSIGREVARLAQAFGMRVLALKRGDDPVDHGYLIPGVGDPAGDIPERYYRPDELHAMLAECEYVVLAVPLTDATHHLIDAEALAALKPGAFLINVARGEVVDESALIRALDRGRLAGAGLDVFEQEPLPPDSPLWGMEDVILTPHIAGSTPRYHARAADLFAENLRRYLAGDPLLNRIGLETAY